MSIPLSPEDDSLLDTIFMKGKRDTAFPQFQSPDAEKQYWEALGPLTEGHKGRTNRPKPGARRSSFLSVRLAGEELTQLRDLAARQGLGPSTFARLILKARLELNSKLGEVAKEERMTGQVELQERQRKAYMFACWQSEILGCHAHLWVPSWLFWLGWLLKDIIFVTWVQIEKEK